MEEHLRMMNSIEANERIKALLENATRLYLTNSGQIPLLVSGTPDGIGALTKRLSTLERITTMG